MSRSARGIGPWLFSRCRARSHDQRTRRAGGRRACDTCSTCALSVSTVSQIELTPTPTSLSRDLSIMSDAVQNRNSRPPHQLQPPNFRSDVQSHTWSRYPGAQGRQQWGSPALALSEGPELVGWRYSLGDDDAQLDQWGSAALPIGIWAPPAAFPLAGSSRLTRRDHRDDAPSLRPQAQHAAGRLVQRSRTLPQSVSQQGYDRIDNSLSVSKTILGASHHPRWPSRIHVHVLSRLQATVLAAQ